MVFQFKFWKRILLVFLINYFVPQAVKANAKPISDSCQKLALEIDSIIDRPEFSKSSWGILVKNLNSGKTIYSRDRDKYFIPASNVKLFTSASTLLELGAEFRIKTPIYASGEFPNLDTLQIKGQGDPTISSESLKNIVQQLHSLGLRSIKKLIIEDSYFPQNPLNPTWEWSDIYYYYATSANSVILNQNTVTLTLFPQKLGEKVKFSWSDNIAARQWNLINNGVTANADTSYNIDIVGVLGKPNLKIQGELPQNNQPDKWGLALADPPNYFLETLRRLFLQTEIAVERGTVLEENWEVSESRIITTMFSTPLKSLIQEINQESNNLYAETVANILAQKLNLETGEAAIKEVLNQLELASDSYILKDGSGLSRHNLVTPEVLVDLLSKMSETPVANIYKESLALAGKTGTLKNSLTNIPGKLWGKTGSLSGVFTLSGYLELPNSETLVFSILVNHLPGEKQLLRKEINKMFVLLSSQSKYCY